MQAGQEWTRQHEGVAVRRSGWRFAFASIRAAVLVGGDKSGISEKRFYRRLIAKADKRFDSHLIEVESGKKHERNKR